MPLHIVTDMIFGLLPFKFGSSKGSKVADLKEPVDSSANFMNNMRYKNKYYFIEDSE